MLKFFSLLLLITYSSTIFADDVDNLSDSNGYKRATILNISDKKVSQIKIILPGGAIEAEMIPFKKANSYIIVPNVRPSDSEKMFFMNVTEVMKWFLRNYKIGKIDKKNFMLAFKADVESGKYAYTYSISFNNLKLLNNRDFGSKDLLKFDKKGGIVYPIKYILRKGRFLTLKGLKKKPNIDKRYKKFLKSYDISPIIEGTIENWFMKKKMK